MSSLSLSQNLWERTAMVDPASGKLGRALGSNTARNALVCIARDRLDRIFVLETWASRGGPEKLEEKIFETQAKWSPKPFGIEEAGQQGLFIGLVERDAARDGIPLAIARVVPSSQIRKLDKIRNAISPVLSSGRLFLPKVGAEELILELRAFPSGNTVDLLDALAGAISLLPRIPLAQASGPESGRYDPEREYRDFLTENGVPPEVARKFTLAES